MRGECEFQSGQLNPEGFGVRESPRAFGITNQRVTFVSTTRLATSQQAPSSQVGSVAASEGEFGSGVECEAAIARIKQLELFNSVNLDDVETADAHEFVCGQAQLDGIESSAQEVGAVTHTQSDVIVSRPYPINISDFEKNDLSLTLHRQKPGSV